ncbi:hypothetical protein BpHYR1_027157 [Brachionus plicatilis]|uniref:Uncharacterized protein n=1 Tax=Brachionus plicatilis TaxID=10195 RepID=A0A3M7QGH8_BRAPC|nr:hypothetical protein BpHYR1_027157 [Brachionus plicatilis]
MDNEFEAENLILRVDVLHCRNLKSKNSSSDIKSGFMTSKGCSRFFLTDDCMCFGLKYIT